MAWRMKHTAFGALRPSLPYYATPLLPRTTTSILSSQCSQALVLRSCLNQHHYATAVMMSRCAAPLKAHYRRPQHSTLTGTPTRPYHRVYSTETPASGSPQPTTASPQQPSPPLHTQRPEAAALRAQASASGSGTGSGSGGASDSADDGPTRHPFFNWRSLAVAIVVMGGVVGFFEIEKERRKERCTFLTHTSHLQKHTNSQHTPPKSKQRKALASRW
eukprot:TRINITY_DN5423_c0_g1_i2.p1 TRINITY_DN5423_c0_g1~~TRINITY_DN5423_c0_g1_i2.p1  ORF type:complete len:226 (+),score=36.20 TRINITY_DN5423_c0_g1_i2:27-680(+)